MAKIPLSYGVSCECANRASHVRPALYYRLEQTRECHSYDPFILNIPKWCIIMSTYFYSFSSRILKRCFSSFWTAIRTFSQNVTGWQECTYGMVRTDFKVFPLRKLPTKVQLFLYYLFFNMEMQNIKYFKPVVCKKIGVTTNMEKSFSFSRKRNCRVGEKIILIWKNKMWICTWYSGSD